MFAVGAKRSFFKRLFIQTPINYDVKKTPKSYTKKETYDQKENQH
ncbi:MAG TPA: hypothetical protein VIK81_03700 [Patescibacteria group bacterium]